VYNLEKGKTMTTTATPAMREVRAMLDEEEALSAQYEREDDMTTSDAQGCASAQMIIKYGKDGTGFLMTLPRNDAMRLLEMREANK
jgi:hypothetical protein